MMPSGGAQAYCWLVEGLVYIQWKKGEDGKHAIFLSLSFPRLYVCWRREAELS